MGEVQAFFSSLLGAERPHRSEHRDGEAFPYRIRRGHRVHLAESRIRRSRPRDGGGRVCAKARHRTPASERACIRARPARRSMKRSRDAEDVLGGGISVIVDATILRRAHRRAGPHAARCVRGRPECARAAHGASRGACAGRGARSDPGRHGAPRRARSDMEFLCGHQPPPRRRPAGIGRCKHVGIDTQVGRSIPGGETRFPSTAIIARSACRCPARPWRRDIPRPRASDPSTGTG
jgi:hypothetical protein